MSKKFMMNSLRDYLLGLVGICCSIIRILDVGKETMIAMKVMSKGI